MCTLIPQGPRLFPLIFNNFIIIIRFILFTQAQLLYYCTQLVNINLFVLWTHFAWHTYIWNLWNTLFIWIQCTTVQSYCFRICAQTLLPPVITLYRSSVHLNCRTCPLLLLVLVLTNGIPSKITLMNRVDQSQGLKCETDIHTHTGQIEKTPALRAVGLEKGEWSIFLFFPENSLLL